LEAQQREVEEKQRSVILLLNHQIRPGEEPADDYRSLLAQTKAKWLLEPSDPQP
jgi:hypothetical protein